MGDGLVLHGSPHSLPTYRVALMLSLCRERFMFRYVSFQRGMHLKPEFRALSRWGQVPVVEYEGRVLVQSAAILQYLAATLRRFDGDDVVAHQQISEWLFWDADRLMPPLYAWYSVELGRRKLLPLSFDPVLVAEFDRKGEAALDILDDNLTDRQFLVGSGTTIADICCYGDIAFANLGGKDLSKWRNVMTWAERIESLPGFSKPLELLAMHDTEVTP